MNLHFLIPKSLRHLLGMFVALNVGLPPLFIWTLSVIRRCFLLMSPHLWAMRLLRRPSNSLMVLSACLLAIDHRWSQLTLGGLSLAVGAFIVKKSGA